MSKSSLLPRTKQVALTVLAFVAGVTALGLGGIARCNQSCSHWFCTQCRYALSSYNIFKACLRREYIIMKRNWIVFSFRVAQVTAAHKLPFKHHTVNYLAMVDEFVTLADSCMAACWLTSKRALQEVTRICASIVGPYFSIHFKSALKRTNACRHCCLLNFAPAVNAARSASQ